MLNCLAEPSNLSKGLPNARVGDGEGRVRFYGLSTLFDSSIKVSRVVVTIAQQCRQRRRYCVVVPCGLKGFKGILRLAESQVQKRTSIVCIRAVRLVIDSIAKEAFCRCGVAAEAEVDPTLRHLGVQQVRLDR